MTLQCEYELREITPEDHGLISDHRDDLFREMDMEESVVLKARCLYSPWLETSLRDGKYVGFVAVEKSLGNSNGETKKERVAATVGMSITIGPPLVTVLSPDLRRATLTNVYVLPEHRRQGLARIMVNRLLDVARDKGIAAVTLHTSEFGRPLYETLGFKDTGELELVL